MIIYVDIDETICTTSDTNDVREYDKSVVVQENLDKINKLYEDGHKIIYWTARGSRTGIDWSEFTTKQLKSWGAKFHEVRCDKPNYDIFVEDKSIRIEELT